MALTLGNHDVTMHLILKESFARPEITRRAQSQPCKPYAANREDQTKNRRTSSSPKKAGGPVECHIVEPTSSLAQLLRPHPATITAVEEKAG